MQSIAVNPVGVQVAFIAKLSSVSALPQHRRLNRQADG